MTYLGEAGEEGRVDNVKKGVLRDETAQAEKKKKAIGRNFDFILISKL